MSKAKCVSCEEEVKNIDDLYHRTSAKKYDIYTGDCETCKESIKSWPNSGPNFFVPVDSGYWDLEKPDYVHLDDEAIPDMILEKEDHRCPRCGGRAFEYLMPSAGRMCIFCTYTS